MKVKSVELCIGLGTCGSSRYWIDLEGKRTSIVSSRICPDKGVEVNVFHGASALE